jgi:hypothetical protein
MDFSRLGVTLTEFSPFFKSSFITRRAPDAKPEPAPLNQPEESYEFNEME